MLGFSKKPIRDREMPKISMTSTSSKIMKCITENTPSDFYYCHDCDYVAQCKRLRRRINAKNKADESGCRV